MKRLTHSQLVKTVGGKRRFDAGKCAAGTLTGAAKGALFKGARLGWIGAAAGGVIGAARGAVNSCM
ncbi:hypothetical protein ACSF83_03075 [Lactobacillus johnsonii]|uniref:hypothetical protein n=1 Tax=Lactobacillus johnsonii TaxID=33959 RepID=UPI0026254D91